MWIFNWTMNKGSILVLNLKSENHGCIHMDNMATYSVPLCTQKNNNIAKYVYYNEPPNNRYLTRIIKYFLDVI